MEVPLKLLGHNFDGKAPAGASLKRNEAQTL